MARWLSYRAGRDQIHPTVGEGAREAAGGLGVSRHLRADFVLHGIGAGAAMLLEVGATGADPGLDLARADLEVALEAVAGGADAKRLVAAGRAGHQQLGAGRQVEGVLMPFEDRLAARKPGQQRILGASVGEFERDVADLEIVEGVDRGGETSSQELAAEADPEHRLLLGVKGADQGGHRLEHVIVGGIGHAHRAAEDEQAGEALRTWRQHAALMGIDVAPAGATRRDPLADQIGKCGRVTNDGEDLHGRGRDRLHGGCGGAGNANILYSRGRDKGGGESMTANAEDPTGAAERAADKGYRLVLEPSPRRVRAVFAGETIADSRRMMLLHESAHVPVYYFPLEDLRQDLLVESTHTTHCPHKGDAAYRSVRVGERSAEDAVWSYPEPIASAADLAPYAAIYWNKMDAWYEEDEEVFVHARDPYARVDAVLSSRAVEVVLGGATVASSRRPRFVFETGLPTRYYLPAEDVRMDLLEPSETLTRCPYKGQARYWRARVGARAYDDIVWSYPKPVPECPTIKDLMCFYNEHVDAILIDGEAEEKTPTPWS